MSRKSVSRTILILFFLSITFSSVLISSAQTNQWTIQEITSNLGEEAPIIDGKKDDVWNNENVNLTYYEFYDEDSSKASISLYVQHYGDSIYFLIVAKFKTNQANETFSIYLSNSNSSSDIFDKKQITMFNASNKGSETSETFDLFTNDTVNYKLDTQDDGFEGSAAFGDATDDQYRYYEYKLKLIPVNTSEDAKIPVFHNYALQVGYNNSESGEEYISSTLLLQVGPKSIDFESGDFTEKQLNLELYIFIVLCSVSGLFVIFGFILFSSKSKMGLSNDFKEGK